jgi:hypothetical protein
MRAAVCWHLLMATMARAKRHIVVFSGCSCAVSLLMFHVGCVIGTS